MFNPIFAYAPILPGFCTLSSWLPQFTARWVFIRCLSSTLPTWLPVSHPSYVDAPWDAHDTQIRPLFRGLVYRIHHRQTEQPSFWPVHWHKGSLWVQLAGACSSILSSADNCMEYMKSYAWVTKNKLSCQQQPISTTLNFHLGVSFFLFSLTAELGSFMLLALPLNSFLPHLLPILTDYGGCCPFYSKKWMAGLQPGWFSSDLNHFAFVYIKS